MTEPEPTVRPLKASFNIASSTDPHLVYVVRLFLDGSASCGCKGFEYTGGCRHIKRAEQLHDDPHGAFAEDVLDYARMRGHGDTAVRALAFDALVIAARDVVAGIYDREKLIREMTDTPEEGPEHE